MKIDGRLHTVVFTMGSKMLRFNRGISDPTRLSRSDCTLAEDVCLGGLHGGASHSHAQIKLL